MALNINAALDVLRRAGLGNDDTMNTGKTERHMAEGLRSTEEDLAAEYLEAARESIEFHRNPHRMSADDLLNIDDL